MRRARHAAPVHGARADHHQRDTGRARRELGCCTSSPDTASAGEPAQRDTRRWLGVGGRRYNLAARRKRSSAVNKRRPQLARRTTGAHRKSEASRR